MLCTKIAGMYYLTEFLLITHNSYIASRMHFNNNCGFKESVKMAQISLFLLEYKPCQVYGVNFRLTPQHFKCREGILHWWQIKFRSSHSKLDYFFSVKTIQLKTSVNYLIGCVTPDVIMTTSLRVVCALCRREFPRTRHPKAYVSFVAKVTKASLSPENT